MICRKCGGTIPDGAEFCSFCGEPAGAQNQNNGAYYSAPQNTAPQGAQNGAYYSPPFNGGAQNAQPHSTVGARMSAPVVSLGKYMLWMIASVIPAVGIILSIIFALDSSEPNRANFFRAILIVKIVGVILSVVLSVLFFFVFGLTADVLLSQTEEYLLHTV